MLPVVAGFSPIFFAKKVALFQGIAGVECAAVAQAMVNVD